MAFPAAAQRFLPCAFLALAASALALIRQEPWPRSARLWPPILTGLGLFVMPILLTSLPSASPDAYTRTVLFTLIPILCLIFEPHIHPNSIPPGRLALPAALAAVFGALCVFPMQFPTSIVSFAAFLAAMLAAASIAAASCLATHIQPSHGTHSFAAIAGLTGAAAFALAGLIQGSPIWTWRPNLPTVLWTAIIELPALLLLLILLRHLSATRAATRYLIAPLLAILAGAALLRQPLTFRTSTGLLLIAAGAIYLLLAPTPTAESNPLSLR